jgi:hypothetical protein
MKKITFLILLTMVFALGTTKYPVQSGRDFEVKRHNVNNIEMCVSNFGKFGQDETGNNAGMWWPVNSGENYIYGAGSWFGTIVDNDTLVTIGYGPSGGQSEYVPGMAGWQVSNADAIIFMYPTDWPPTAATLPMAPQEIKSHQDSWCVYNDLDEQYHMPGDTRPIGLEVYQTVYAWNLSTTADIIFVQYEIKNVSGSDLTDCWFGVATDNDIGNEAGQGNDICSGIVGQEFIMGIDTFWIDNLGYQWQNEPEAGWTTFPGVIGFDYLQSPFDLVEGADKDNDGIPDQYEMDSAYYWNNLPQEMWDVDADGTPDWRDPSEIPQLGMQSFMRFTLDLEPGSDAERYVCMEGYNYITGVYVQYDTVIPDPDDQRFVQCSGPFELGADSSVIVLVGVMCAARSGPEEAPDSAIVPVDDIAQYIYDQNWLLPGPPAPPILTCIPGDAQITIIWDSGSETYADPYYEVVGWDSINNQPYNEALYDSFYVKYDFQGYGIWKSLNSQDWTLLGRCDLYDDVVFDDSAATEIYANNTGLVHFYVDTDVRNGFEYYYAITAFDYNWVTGVDTLGNEYGRPIWFESGKVGITAAPRRDPANYQAGVIDIDVLKGNPLLGNNNVSTWITYPMQMTDDMFYLDFGPIVYDDGDPMYSAVLSDANGNSLADVGATLVPGDLVFSEFGTRNGISITAILQREDIPEGSIFDRIEVTSGTYPEDYLMPITILTTNWAYRGDDYEVHWIRAYGSDSVNSVVVIDVQVGDTIPFKSGTTGEEADGWCFETLFGSEDTLVYGGIPTGTRNLYICGGKFRIAQPIPGHLAPGDPRPEIGDIWIVYANSDYMPAPANARLQIIPTPASYMTDQVAMNVKVSPNPYLIHNEWQQTFNPRRLKFINLPAECTIRIFNLNGELVRAITHVSTLEPGIGEQEVLGSAGGDEWWDLLTDNRQLISSGVYIFHIQSDVGEQVGKFVVIR